MSESRDTSQHLGDLAELHALGTLEPHERASVESHVAACASCARALGTAEATVAALDDAFVAEVDVPEALGRRIATSARVAEAMRSRPLHASRFPRSFIAAAAAVVLAVGLAGGALLQRSAQLRDAAHDSAIVATIATSHFNHASFIARNQAAPVSKVLYARDGRWLYVLIDGAACACHVVALSPAGERDLGKPETRGSTATLFARTVARPTSLELRDGSGRIVAVATLRYPKSP